MTIWIRSNGQAGLRERLRVAIKEAGLTQAEAARQADIGRSHLVGGLNGNNWLTVRAVEALAHVLEIPADELVGDSIFKHERDRYAEFDHMPPKVVAWRAEQEAKEAQAKAAREGEGRSRALCCECGTLRTFSTRGMHPFPESLVGAHARPGARGRFLRTMRCETCDQQTRHALLRIDNDRDSAEHADHAPTLADEARRELHELMARLRGFNVRLESRTRRLVKNKVWPVAYEYDELEGQWCIEIDDTMPARVQINALKDVWRRISADDHKVDWDPRGGVLIGPTETSWAETTDELITDMQRYLAVERRRVVAHYSDQAEVAQAATREHFE